MPQVSLYNAINECVQLLLFLCLPLTAVAALAGTLASLLQATTSISDSVLTYAAKLVGIVVLAYFFLPVWIHSIQKLALRAFQ
jgi:type III secretory pathway component EscS